MKKKTYKIMSVLLTVMLLAGLSLSLAAVPAGAASTGNTWVKFQTPIAGEDGDWFMSWDIDGLGPMDISKDGNDLYVAVEVDSDMNIFRSDDGGRTWEETGYLDEEQSDDMPVEIVCSSQDEDIVYVCDGTWVYWSQDRGETFNTLSSPPVEADSITCMDVAYLNSQPLVFIGTIGNSVEHPEVSYEEGNSDDDDVFVCQQAQYGMPWSGTQVLNNRAVDYTNVDVFDVKVSQTFASDQLLIAVVSNTNGDGTFATFRYGGEEFGSRVADAELLYGDDSDTAFDLPYNGSATIWLPDDFSSEPTTGKMEFFVGCNDGTSSALGGDVYWVLGATDPPTVYDLGVGDTYDLYGTGNVGSAKMIAGCAASGKPNIKYSKDGRGDSWSSSSKDPTGTTGNFYRKVFVRCSDDFGDMWAVTRGDNRAMSYSTDGKYFNQISLMDYEWGNITDIEPSPDWGSSGALFMVTDEGTMLDWYADSLFKYDGEYWERIFHNSLMSSDDYPTYISDVECSPEWATDNCVVFMDRNNNRYYSSTDGGQKFTKSVSQPVEPSVDPISVWLVIDKDTYLAGSGTTGDIYRTTNGATYWYQANVSPMGDEIESFAVDPNDSDNILAANDDGEVYMSSDAGEEWDLLPLGERIGTSNNDVTYVAFDPDFAHNDMIYGARGDDWNVYRLEVGSDTVWRKISDLPGTWPQVDGAPASIEPLVSWVMGSWWGLDCLQVAPDGTLYVIDTNVEPVARCVNPTADLRPVRDAPYFETIDVDWPGSWAPDGLWITEGSSNMLWTIRRLSGGSVADEIWTYTDEVTTPVLEAPADGTSSLRVNSVTLSWDEVENATKYIVYFDSDPGFATYDAYGPFFSTTEATRVDGLEDGMTYYWKVAVWVNEPCLSLWSPTWKFDTALSVSQWNPFVGGVPEAPYNGATNVPLTPTFAWNAADWATHYEFVLADNDAFASPIVSKTGANALTTTVYLCEQKLSTSDTYFWKVRAKKGDTYSEWATAVFTTEGPPPTAPAPPPAPTYTTEVVEEVFTAPIYIWVIIGIGAALVIAVIILIIRTRRIT